MLKVKFTLNRLVALVAADIIRPVAPYASSSLLQKLAGNQDEEYVDVVMDDYQARDVSWYLKRLPGKKTNLTGYWSCVVDLEEAIISAPYLEDPTEHGAPGPGERE